MNAAAIVVAFTGYLIEASGEIRLQHRAASRACPAGVGAIVQSGDTIRVGRKAKARILCPDLLTTWEPAAQTESGVFEGCPRNVEQIRIREGQRALGVRAAGRVPWVLMPSNTAVMTATPLIRWDPVPGASHYRVAIFENTTPPRPIWGPARVIGSIMRYSGSRALVPGTDYFVRIETDDGAVAEGRPFYVAAADLQKNVDERLRHFERTIPHNTAREIAAVVYLLSQNLRADALPLIETLVGTNESLSLKLLHARCLGDIGASSPQIDVLRSALDDAERMRDRHSEAEVLLQLAQISPKRDEAAQMSSRAADLLRRLGLQPSQGAN